jgi:hypothetical protein
VSSVSVNAKCTGTNLKGTSTDGYGVTIGVYALPTVSYNLPPYQTPYVVAGQSIQFPVSVAGPTAMFPVAIVVAESPSPIHPTNPTVTQSTSSLTAAGNVTVSMAAASTVQSGGYLWSVVATSQNSYGRSISSYPVLVAPVGSATPAPTATPTMPPGCYATMGAAAAQYPWATTCIISPYTPITLPLWTYAVPPADESDQQTTPDVNETCSVQSWSWVYPPQLPFTFSGAYSGIVNTNPCVVVSRMVGGVTVEASPSAASPQPTQLARMQVKVNFLDPDDNGVPTEQDDYSQTLTPLSQNGYLIILNCGCYQDVLTNAAAQSGSVYVTPQVLEAIAWIESGGHEYCGNSLDVQGAPGWSPGAPTPVPSPGYNTGRGLLQIDLTQPPGEGPAPWTGLTTPVSVWGNAQTNANQGADTMASNFARCAATGATGETLEVEALNAYNLGPCSPTYSYGTTVYAAQQGIPSGFFSCVGTNVSMSTPYIRPRSKWCV